MVSAVTVVYKAKEGRGAFLRQARYSEMISRKEIIYDAEDEMYPNPVMMLLVQKPFHAMGPMWGSVFWLIFKYLMMLFIFWTVVKVTRNNGPPWPDWALVILLFLSMRVFIGDLTHANVNLVTGGLIMAAFLCAFNEKDFLSGMAIGLAAALRVTPSLFVLYFAYKRQWLSIGGAIVAISLFCWLVPGLILGFEYSNVLTQEWFRQMLSPFLAGQQSGTAHHINQSFTGFFYRLLSDSVAIKADIERGYDELRINFFSLDRQSVSLIVRVASILVMGCLAWFCRTPREHHKNIGIVGEYALVFLAMLFISPRSWKHHYVLIILAHSFLLYNLLNMGLSGWKRWVPLSSLLFASICFLFSSDLMLGHYWSNVAEAYGAYVIGGISLFVGCGAMLTALRLDGWPNASKLRQESPPQIEAMDTNMYSRPL